MFAISASTMTIRIFIWRQPTTPFSSPRRQQVAISLVISLSDRDIFPAIMLGRHTEEDAAPDAPDIFRRPVLQSTILPSFRREPRCRHFLRYFSHDIFARRQESLLPSSPNIFSFALAPSRIDYRHHFGLAVPPRAGRPFRSSAPCRRRNIAGQA